MQLNKHYFLKGAIVGFIALLILSSSVSAKKAFITNFSANLKPLSKLPSLQKLSPFDPLVPLSPFKPITLISPTLSVSPTVSPTASPTPTVTPSNTPTPTPTLSESTPTPTMTPTAIPTLTLTPTATPTPTPEEAEEILINEFLAHPSSGEKEWVELYNPANLDISSLFIDDDFSFTNDTGSSNKISLSQAVLNGNIYPYIELSSFLNNSADHVVLFSSTGEVMDSYSYLSDPGIDVSIGRHPDGMDFVMCNNSSKGSSNNSTCILAVF